MSLVQKKTLWIVFVKLVYNEQNSEVMTGLFVQPTIKEIACLLEERIADHWAEYSLNKHEQALPEQPTVKEIACMLEERMADHWEEYCLNKPEQACEPEQARASASKREQARASVRKRAQA